MTPKREWALLLVLATIMFTQLMDFVIMMPLGPQFMRYFAISPAQFAWMISAYGFASATAGVSAALFIDRFDRKTALLTLYAGFTVATFLCAIAPTHPLFILARVAAGFCAGIMTPVSYSIVGDLIPAERRGAANGTLMSSFAVASVAGVPLGLVLANAWTWRAPFLLLAAMSVVAGVVAWFVLPPVGGHLARARELAAGRGGYAGMLELFRPMNHRWSLVLANLMTMAGFTLIPYTATAMVFNGGLLETDLPWIYVCGGFATLFSARYLGKLADRHGPLPVYWWVVGISLIPVLGVGYIRPAPAWIIMLLMTAFTVFVSGRFVVGTTLIHNGVDPVRRGGFLSLMAAFQSASSGLASLVAGWMVVKSEAGPLEGLPEVSWLAFGCALVSAWVAARIIPLHKKTVAPAPLTHA